MKTRSRYKFYKSSHHKFIVKNKDDIVNKLKNFLDIETIEHALRDIPEGLIDDMFSDGIKYNVSLSSLTLSRSDISIHISPIEKQRNFLNKLHQYVSTINIHFVNYNAGEKCNEVYIDVFFFFRNNKNKLEINKRINDDCLLPFVYPPGFGSFSYILDEKKRNTHGKWNRKFFNNIEELLPYFSDKNKNFLYKNIDWFR